MGLETFCNSYCHNINFYINNTMSYRVSNPYKVKKNKRKEMFDKKEIVKPDGDSLIPHPTLKNTWIVK